MLQQRRAPTNGPAALRDFVRSARCQKQQLECRLNGRGRSSETPPGPAASRRTEISSIRPTNTANAELSQYPVAALRSGKIINGTLTPTFEKEQTS